MTTSETSTPLKIWQPGSCHCGAVSFEIFHEPLYAIQNQSAHVSAISCDCSICRKNGYYLIYPTRDEIKWKSGWDEMKDYRFATEDKVHKFCGTCGSSVCIDFLGGEGIQKFLGKSGDLLGMNVRLLEDIDIDKLNLDKRDGKNFGVPYDR